MAIPKMRIAGISPTPIGVRGEELIREVSLLAPVGLSGEFNVGFNVGIEVAVPVDPGVIVIVGMGVGVNVGVGIKTRAIVGTAVYSRSAYQTVVSPVRS